MTADLLLYNGRVLASGAPTEMAVRGGVIAALGRAGELRAWVGPRTEVIDLAGRVVLPGFVDAHTHLLEYGRSLQQVNCRPQAVRAIDEIIAAIRARAAGLPEGAWVLAIGYDDNRLAERRHPTRHDLDAAAPGRPVVLTRTCGHVLVASSAALRLAGVDEFTADPPGGRIDRDRGRVTGVLRERAMDLVTRVLPRESEDEQVALLEDAGRRYLAMGVTSVTNAALEGSQPPGREVRIYQRAWAAGRLPVRVTMMLSGELLDEVEALGLVTGFGDRSLRLGAIKWFLDGGIGPMTAAMSEPYEGSDERGFLRVDPDALRAGVRRAHDLGWQVSMHAIGDVAVRIALDAIEAAQAEHPRPDARHRIEHCGMVDDAQRARLVRLGVIPVPQPHFLTFMGRVFADKVGPRRERYMYPLRALVDAGLRVPLSSDAPVVPDPSPLVGLHGAVTRQARGDGVIGRGEELTITQALAGYTMEAAYAEGTEGWKGSIEVEKAADLVVLSDDPREVAADALPDLHVELTLVGGKIAYQRE